MKTFRSGLTRCFRGIRPFLLLLCILTLATICVCVGVGVYTMTNEQTKAIEDSYTVLAVQEKSLGLFRFSGTDKWFSSYFEKAIDMNALEKTLSDPEYAVSYNQSRAFAGVTEGLYPLIRKSAGGGALPAMTVNDKAMFLITCDSLFDTMESPYTPMGVIIPFQMETPAENEQYSRTDRYIVTVDEVLALHPSVPAPKSVILSTSLRAPDGSLLLENGKQYVVCGAFTDSRGYELLSGQPKTDGGISASGESSMDEPLTAPREAGGNYVYFTTDLNDSNIMLPDAVGVENRLKLCRALQSGIMVFGVKGDGVYTMKAFHTGTDFLTEGRNFTREEIENGEAVCIVSQAFAYLNGLNVGDSIPLAFTNQTIGTGSETTSMDDRHYLLMDFSDEPYRELPGKLSLQIVGLYAGPVAMNSLHSVSINTVFLPDALLPKEGGWRVDTTGTIQVKKGAEQAFNAAMKEAGLEIIFKLYDGGYAKIKDSVQRVRRDGLLISAICAAVFLMLALASLIIVIARRGEENRFLRLLGTPKKTVRGMTFFSVLPVILLAGALGGGVAMIFSGSIREILSRLNPVGDAFSARAASAVQAVSVAPSQYAAVAGVATLLSCLIALIVTCISVSRIKLMDQAGGKI